MIDFTNCKVNNYKYYGGKNGGKKCIIYDNKNYMLKFPSLKDNTHVSYSNSCISEYITCKIIETIGLNVQKTILGIYNTKDAEKVVVACQDFTENGYILKEFAELKNSQIDSSQNGYGTELNDVIETIESQTIYDTKELKYFFWDMFIVDAFVGNFDRHNGNWGFLINEDKQDVKLAPIYDCASCLYPQLTDDQINWIINDLEELDARIFVFPNSALKVDDKKINYFDYISGLKNTECNNALLRIFPKININKINEIIDNTPYITKLRKEFYKKILKMRYDKILRVNYDKLV